MALLTIFWEDLFPVVQTITTGLIVSGQGHLNMNHLKTFFKVFGKVFLEVLGQEVLKFDRTES